MKKQLPKCRGSSSSLTIFSVIRSLLKFIYCIQAKCHCYFDIYKHTLLLDYLKTIWQTEYEDKSQHDSSVPKDVSIFKMEMFE